MADAYSRVFRPEKKQLFKILSEYESLNKSTFKTATISLRALMEFKSQNAGADFQPKNTSLLLKLPFSEGQIFNFTWSFSTNSSDDFISIRSAKSNV